MKLTKECKLILKYFHQEGFQAYLVGGYVRDQLLNITSKDYDIATDALPKEIIRIAEKYQLKYDATYQKLGNILLIFDGCILECTTMRKETYETYRFPEQIIYTDDLNEDAKRRDFTINALYYDDKLIDPVNGLVDLKNETIKIIGNPTLRFQEDPLRMLRAIRFKQQLNFQIEHATGQAIIENASLTKKLSNDKIRMELIKTIRKNHHHLLESYHEYHVLTTLFPEFIGIIDLAQNTPYHCYDVFKHTCVACNNYPYHDEKIILALMFHDLGKKPAKTTDENNIDHFKKHALYSAELATNILNRLHFPKKDANYIVSLVRDHDIRFDQDNYKDKVNQLILKHQGNFNYLQDLITVAYYDNTAKSKLITQHQLTPIIDAYHYLCSRKDCLSVKDLAINGNDLKTIIDDYTKYHDILNNLLAKVLSDKINNDKKILLEEVRNEIFNR